MSRASRSTGRPASRPGTLVGRFVLRELIASTPRHRLFLARGLSGGRELEIKIMQPRHQLRTEDTGDVSNPYARELRLAVEAHSECILRHMDAGTTTGGEHYLVRDRPEGLLLRDLMAEDGPMLLPAAAAVVADVSSAAEAAHRLGYVLRDVRPEVLAVREHATGLTDTKLIDVGMACRIGTSGLTCASDHLVASTLYLAPEIARGEPATPASDVYAVSSLLYELLSGHPMLADIGADDQLRLAWLRGDERVPPKPIRQLVPSLPSDVELLLAKCCHRDPNQRPGDMAQLARGLTHVLKAWVQQHGDASVPKELWPRLTR